MVCLEASEASVSEVTVGSPRAEAANGDSRQVPGHTTQAENDQDGGSECSTESRDEDETMSAEDKAAIAAAHARIKASMVIHPDEDPCFYLFLMLLFNDLL